MSLFSLRDFFEKSKFIGKQNIHPTDNIRYGILCKRFGDYWRKMADRNFMLNFYRFLLVGIFVGFFVFNTNAQIANVSDQLAGSYQLDDKKNENMSAVVENISRKNGLSAADKADLEVKLSPPSTLSIEIDGTEVSLASSTSEPVTLNADGRMQVAYAAAGTKVSIRSSLLGDTLKVSSLYGSTDYSITFRSVNNGKSLQVTRTVTTDYLKQTVFADSFYNRMSSPPIFAGNFGKDERFSNNDSIVPNGTVLTGVLENYISTKDSKNNDPFRLTVQTPGEFQGAMIEGYLSGIERADGVSGTAKMTLNFQKILLTNGQIYSFSGIIQTVADSKERTIKSNDESQVRGKNKTNESVKRGVLGAVVGAGIGAAISGKKGALIGAAIGGGGGTATVLFEGKDLELERGSQINIQSTSSN